MARDSSRRWHAINHLGGKSATQGKHRPCFDPKPVIDFFQSKRLLLAIPHASFKGPGRCIPGVEAGIGEFSGSKVLRMCDKVPTLQIGSPASFYCVIDRGDPIYRHTAWL